MRERVGPSADWSVESHLLATVLDAIQMGNWQRGGGKNSRPKPVKRPGADRVQKVGASFTIDEFEQRYAQWPVEA